MRLIINRSPYIAKQLYSYTSIQLGERTPHRGFNPTNVVFPKLDIIAVYVFALYVMIEFNKCRMIFFNLMMSIPNLSVSISSSGDPSRVNPSFPSWSENPSLSRLPSLPQDIPTLIIQSPPQKWPTENVNPTMTSAIESCLN